MPRVILTRSLTQGYRLATGQLVSFKRGTAVEVSERDYLDLLRTGKFVDPDSRMDFVRPDMLKSAPPGTVVPILRDIGLGDVLMATIPLRDLARKYPRLRFVYGCHSKFAPILKGQMPFLAAVKPMNKITGNYQWAVDLRAYVERHPACRRVDRIDLFSQYLIGGPPSSYVYPIRATSAMIDEGHELAHSSGTRPLLVIATRASMLNRSWGGDYNRQLSSIAQSQGWRVVLTDQRFNTPGEHGEGPQLIDLTGELTPWELACIVSAADVVVSPDTGTAHLAEALKTRCAAYFTTVPPNVRVGHYSWTRAVYPHGRLSCLGCTHSPTCGQPDPKPCGLLCTPEEIWRQVEILHDGEPPWNPYSWEDPSPERNREELEAAEVF